MASYVFPLFSEESFRLINQTGVRQAHPKAEGYENYNCNWDGALAPDGTFYFTLSSEAGRCDHARLVRYDYDRNEIIECFYAADILAPKDRQLPHSKLHTSINFIPRGAEHGDLSNPSDYLVLAATHSTDRARQHTEWMPFGHHNDLWEGYPGSQILIYDPKSGHAKSIGTPVPRESIYGAKYDPVHNRLYMVGFMRGHIYSYDLATKKVVDLGRGMEFCSYRLSLGGDGNIYGGSKAGYFFRVDTNTNTLESLGWKVPDYPAASGDGDNYINNTWYRWMSLARNHPSGKFLYMLAPCTDHLWKYDYETKTVTRAGRMLPKDGIVELPSRESCYATYTFAIDRDGVLWYTMRGWSMKNRQDYVYNIPCYLIRWDIDRGREPEVMGIMGTPENTQRLTCEMEYDPVRDILYCCNVGRGFGALGPDVIAIDLKEYRKHMYEPGPVSEDPALRPRELTDDEKRKRDERLHKFVGEEVTEKNPFQPVPDADCYPVRIFEYLAPERILDAAVIGMAWEGDILHVITGAKETFDEAAYVFRIRGREVLGVLDFACIRDEYRDWLRENILPKPVDFPGDIPLPEATGRRYRAKASAVCDWNGGRKLVGTMDGLFAVVTDKNVYSLGNAAAYGPVRCLCTDADCTVAYGTAGDHEDMGYLFTYDDRRGLRQMGIISYNSHGFYGTTQANILTSVALSPDGKTLAVGNSDRMACVHLLTLQKE
ncbi:MAG: hypothetical protein ACOXZM_03285 [Eubacteriales bacterium]|jgi:hypothetical protein